MAKKSQVAQTAEQLRDVYQQLSDELYRSFDFFNTKFAEGKLPRPVITVATAGRSKALGLFTDSAWKTGETIIHEITMCGESMNLDVITILGTLAHEMVHLDNFMEHGEIKDCSPQQRHNMLFKNKAEKYKLIVTKSQRFGFGHTSEGEAFKAIVENELKPKKEVFSIYRDNFQNNKEKKKYKGKLKPVMVSEETKTAIEEGAKEMGVSQKEFAQAAVETYRNLGINVKTVAELIFTDRKKYKTAAEIEAILMDTLTPAKAEVATAEEAPEEESAD